MDSHVHDDVQGPVLVNTWILVKGEFGEKSKHSKERNWRIIII
jgi:hypothetical protein